MMCTCMQLSNPESATHDMRLAPGVPASITDRTSEYLAAEQSASMELMTCTYAAGLCRAASIAEQRAEQLAGMASSLSCSRKASIPSVALPACLHPKDMLDWLSHSGHRTYAMPLARPALALSPSMSLSRPVPPPLRCACCNPPLHSSGLPPPRLSRHHPHLPFPPGP